MSTEVAEVVTQTRLLVFILEKFGFETPLLLDSMRLSLILCGSFCLFVFWLLKFGTLFFVP